MIALTRNTKPHYNVQANYLREKHTHLFTFTTKAITMHLVRCKCY